VKLDFSILQSTFRLTLEKYGFHPDRAGTIADVFAETTFDGVFSHGINRFPRFVRDVRSGVVVPGANPVKKGGSRAFEQWDGMKGAGITNALHCTDRAIQLARQYGIGCVGLRNTNHWMRGGTYGWRAAERGFLFIGWTNTLPNMPPWQGKVPTLGNNPFIMAIPHRPGPVVLDMAMSQYSYGKLEWYEKNGEDLPEYGGYDHRDRLTKDPSEILGTGRILPIGLWKGSALSMVLDLAAAVLSGGHTSREIGKLPAETELSQVFIVAEPDRFLGDEEINLLIDDTLRIHSELNPEARYPGQRSMRDRDENRKSGIEVPDQVWKEILAL
jgi:3-dehydro-L-gulonate 2-dehydrogenase